MQTHAPSHRREEGQASQASAGAAARLKKMKSRWLWKVATRRPLKLGSWWNRLANMRPAHGASQSGSSKASAAGARAAARGQAALLP